MPNYKPFLLLIPLCVVWFGLRAYTAKTMFYPPDAAQVDLEPLLQQATFSPDEYTLLFEQTGLRQPIIDKLRATPDGTREILSFQASYFNDLSFYKTPMNAITSLDRALNASGEPIPAFKMAPYDNGYIFLTKSTYTANWRHGHAGLVVDATRGKILESSQPGTVTKPMNISSWVYYPTFKMMRLKDTPQETLDEVARFATDNLMGIPYNILTLKSAVDTFTDTHCSFVVWQAFKAFGIDLDVNGGVFVSPQDIAASPHLETLQIFGFNPAKDW